MRRGGALSRSSVRHRGRARRRRRGTLGGKIHWRRRRRRDRRTADVHVGETRGLGIGIVGDGAEGLRLGRDHAAGIGGVRLAIGIAVRPHATRQGRGRQQGGADLKSHASIPFTIIVKTSIAWRLGFRLVSRFAKFAYPGPEPRGFVDLIVSADIDSLRGPAGAATGNTYWV